MKPQLQKQIQLTIKRLGIHGEGIGESDGFTIFVQGALPGETVTATITEVRKNFARAELDSIQQQSPHRVIPPCPVFGRCGGCQLQHLDYPQQLETKRQRVVDALERIGKIFVPVNPCIPSPNPYAYRNKIQLPVIVNSYVRMGLYAFNSHDLVEIEKCYIHCELGEQAFRTVHKLIFPDPSLRHVLIKTGIKTKQVLVIFVTQGEGSPLLPSLAEKIMQAMPEIKGVVQNINTSSGNVILGKTNRVLAGQPYIEELISGLRFKVSPASFFQVNPPQAENLYQKAIEFCNLKGEEIVLDAYCGVGTLSLILAPHAQKVIGVESVPDAISDAEENAKSNRIKNVSFICAQVEDYLPTTPIDVVILNPPRKGCDPAVLEKLTAPCVVYISCDPATLARDLALLQSRGYKTEEVQPFDMFPQTVHVETVVRLSS